MNATARWRTAVLKWNVPVDDQAHSIGAGPIALVACQHGPDSVQVWTVEPLDQPDECEVRVYGTGHDVPSGWSHVGSTMPIPELIWHVFRNDR